MLGMLFALINRRKISAQEFASRYDISQRTVYRYMEELCIAGVPVDAVRGARGGIYISDAYKLPKGLFTKEEYVRTLDALEAMNEQLRDEALTSAIEKLSSQFKREQKDLTLSGNILVDSGTWGDTHCFSQKIALVSHAVQEKEILEIDYVSREGEHTKRKIHPQLLVFKQNIWYVYAFCETREEFRLFKLGRIRSAVQTGETFIPLPFSREDVPLNFWQEENMLDAVFEISPTALPFAEEWLGVENITPKDGKLYAEVTLPNDETLVGKILSVGAGFEVVSPLFLAERVKEEARRIAKQYEK